MSTEVKEKAGTKWYELKYKASDYTFPSDEPRVDHVWFDSDFLHVALEDGRRLSIPLKWVPTIPDD